MSGRSENGRRLYGIGELAALLNVSEGAIRARLHRNAGGVPEPDERLASGPVWFAETVDAWVKAQR